MVRSIAAPPSRSRCPRAGSSVLERRPGRNAVVSPRASRATARRASTLADLDGVRDARPAFESFRSPRRPGEDASALRAAGAPGPVDVYTVAGRRVRRCRPRAGAGPRTDVTCAILARRLGAGIYLVRVSSGRRAAPRLVSLTIVSPFVRLPGFRARGDRVSGRSGACGAVGAIGAGVSGGRPEPAIARRPAPRRRPE